jgi:DNA-binding NarL/FixJ family response regulator
MISRSKGPCNDSDGIRSFRFEHDGEELFVVSSPVEGSGPAPLTRAELEIVRAIVRGATNAEIAQMRGTSARTVANQVASILRRVGAESRVQAALKLALIDLWLKPNGK